MRVHIGPYRNYNKKTKVTPERKIKVQIDKWDTWSMDHTLGLIILPMLKQLKATKHGSPHTEDVDAPEHLRSTAAPVDDGNEAGDYEGGEAEKNIHARWSWILDEMIWSFEQINNEDAEDQFWSGESHYLWQPLDMDHNPVGEPSEMSDRKAKAPKGTAFWSMVQGPNHTLVHDMEAHKAYSARVDNGFRLFGKYYRGLWD